MKTYTSSAGLTYTVTGAPRGGGQAEVFPAVSPTGAAVALKVARDRGHASTSLRREGRELRRLLGSHAELSEYLVPVLDAGDDESGRHVLVLPWYEQDLHTWLQGRSLSDRLRAAEAACLAVIRLHRSARDWRVGVVHRDIKPKNLLVTDPAKPHLLLADFGGAWRSGGSTSVGAGFHTIGYAPPDQALPCLAEPDRSWDVYALAVTVFECLVGRVPIGTRAATYAYTHEGHELLALMESEADGPLPPAQDQRLRHLTSLGVPHLVDLARVVPLAELDRSVLETTLSIAPTALPELLDALDDALHADPALRQSDARPLARAVAGALRRVARAAEAQRQARERNLPEHPDSVKPFQRRDGRREPTPEIPDSVNPFKRSDAGHKRTPEEPTPPPKPKPAPKPTPAPTTDQTAPRFTGAEPPPAPPHNAIWHHEGSGLELVYVSEGPFQCGTDSIELDNTLAALGVPEAERHHFSDESPARQLHLPAFWVARHPVTNIQFSRFIDATGYDGPEHLPPGTLRGRYQRLKAHAEGPGADYPVHDLSWYEARDFCQWIGPHVDLPTEAQWEKAARGTDGRTFPWGNDVRPGALRTAENTFPPDGSKVDATPGNVSPYGCVQMVGNIGEWCLNAFPGTVEWTAPPDWTLAPTQEAALRGGNVLRHGAYARCGSRDCAPAGAQANFIGFRVVWDPSRQRVDPTRAHPDGATKPDPAPTPDEASPPPPAPEPAQDEAGEESDTDQAPAKAKAASRFKLTHALVAAVLCGAGGIIVSNFVYGGRIASAFLFLPLAVSAAGLWSGSVRVAAAATVSGALVPLAVEFGSLKGLTWPLGWTALVWALPALLLSAAFGQGDRPWKSVGDVLFTHALTVIGLLCVYLPAMIATGVVDVWWAACPLLVVGPIAGRTVDAVLGGLVVFVQALLTLVVLVGLEHTSASFAGYMDTFVYAQRYDWIHPGYSTVGAVAVAAAAGLGLCWLVAEKK